MSRLLRVMVGLDGIRMLDPSTSRTLRIYPLDTVTRCEAIDSSVLAFWSKSSVDIDPRRIRLQSNSYTTSTILDAVVAATVQFKETGGRSRPSESPKPATAESIEEKKRIWRQLQEQRAQNRQVERNLPARAAYSVATVVAATNASMKKESVNMHGGQGSKLGRGEDC